MNTRGAISHGKKISLVYSIQDKKKDVCASDIFDAYGGYKELPTTSDIKEELMNHGPVVSTSFVQTKAFMENKTLSNLLIPPSKFRYIHPVLIVGWKQTPYGEVWLIKPFDMKNTTYTRPLTIPIACGQNGIEDNCIAPVNTFENVAWEDGPYFDINVSSTPEWRTRTGVDHTESHLDNLGDIFKDGLIAASKNKSRIVVRDVNKKAHSKAGYLEEIKRVDGKWKITIFFHLTYILLMEIAIRQFFKTVTSYASFHNNKL